MRTTHTTTVTVDGEPRELELSIDVGSPEYDVGIMSAYVDDWYVTSVDGDTAQATIEAMHIFIEAEYGDEAWLDKLYAEGAVDVDDGDYYED